MPEPRRFQVIYHLLDKTIRIADEVYIRPMGASFETTEEVRDFLGLLGFAENRTAPGCWVQAGTGCHADVYDLLED